MRSEYDVIVVGAGALGVFHALAAVRRGLRTVLIERSRWPVAASVRNFGMVIPAGMPAGPWRERGRRSVAIYRHLEHEFGIDVDDVGFAFVAADDAEMAVLEEFAKSDEGRAAEVVLESQAEALRRAPGLRSEAVAGLLWFPDHLRIEPRTVLRRLLGCLVDDAGLVLRNQTVAVGVVGCDGGAVVATARGERFSAREVFVCSGSDLETLLPQVYDDAKLVHVKLQMMRLEPPPAFRLGPMMAFGPSMHRYPTFDDCAARAALPPLDTELADRGIHVLAATDHEGGIVLGDSHSEHTAGHNVGPRSDERTDDLVLDFARRRLRLDAARVTHRWLGVYTRSPDGLFETTVDGHIHVCTGIGGRGMTAAPALAEERVARVFGGRRGS